MTTTLNLSNLQGDPSGLPDKNVVRQAQKNFSMNAWFWVLIKHLRIPYKIVEGKLVEASYTEAVKGLKNPPVMAIYWLTDQELITAGESAQKMTDALKIAEQEKMKLEPFKK